MTAIMTSPTATISTPQPAPTALAAIPFGRLLRVEWSKATDTRSARWLIVITAVVTAGLMLIPMINQNVDQTYSSYLSFAASGLAGLLPVISIMTLTTEWTQRTVLSTFTMEPRRARVISAKVVVAVLIGLGGVVFGALVTAAAIGLSAASGRDIANDLGAAKIIGYVLFMLLNVMLGVAFGALLHNTAAAIVLFFVLPTVTGLLGGAAKHAAGWFDTSTSFRWVLDGHWSGHVAMIVVCTLIWVALPLAAGFARTVRREIK